MLLAGFQVAAVSSKVALNDIMHWRITIHQIVALLGLVLAVAVFSLLYRFGVPEKVCWGAAILSILVVGIFWSTIQLGAEDEDED